MEVKWLSCKGLIKLLIDDMYLLDALSSRTGETKENLVKKFIADGAEDMGDVIVAQDVREEIRSGRERVYTQEELDCELSLDNLSIPRTHPKHSKRWIKRRKNKQKEKESSKNCQFGFW